MGVLSGSGQMLRCASRSKIDIGSTVPVCFSICWLHWQSPLWPMRELPHIFRCVCGGRQDVCGLAQSCPAITRKRMFACMGLVRRYVFGRVVERREIDRCVFF